MNSIEAVVKDGHVVRLGDVILKEGSRVLVTLADTYDQEFWLSVSEHSLKKIWDNEKDELYAELLKK